MRSRAFAASMAIVAAAACSPGDAPVAIPSATLTPAPAPTPSRSVEISPSAGAMLSTVRAVAAFGPREAVSPAYRRAAAYVGRRLSDLGYRVRTQAVPVPAGVNDGISVAAGVTSNVIAEPPGFDPARPYVVVGGHLDTVPDSPGANDNASGIAVVLELARLARAQPPRPQVVFVAFGAEERRRQSRSESVYAAGSFAYVRSIRGTAVRAALVLDMIGTGSVVSILGHGSAVVEARNAARALGIHAPVLTTRYYSDHVPFERARIPVAWLYAGSHPSFHTPRDVPSVVRGDQLVRMARVAWETLRHWPD